MAQETKTADQRKSDAIASTTAGIEEEVAVFIKQKYLLLQNAFKLDAASDEDFKRMGKEAIDKRSISIGGKTVTLDQVDNELKSAQLGRELLKREGVENAHDLVPTRDQVTSIATTVGDAVFANLGSGPKGIAVTNIPTYLRSGVEGVAGNFRASTVKNLTELKNNDARLAKFLSDGPDGGIATIGEAVYQNVLNPDAPKVDRVKEAKVQSIDEAQVASAAKTVHNEFYFGTVKAIGEEVDKRIDDAGFFGTLAKMLGPGISNMLISIMNFFTGLFGAEPMAQIPSPAEVSNASKVVADTARDITNEVMTGKTTINGKDADKEIAVRIRANLGANRDAHFPSFSDKQLDEMAQKAGKAAQENLVTLPNPQNSTKASADLANAINQAKDQSYQPATPEGYQSPATMGQGAAQTTGRTSPN